MNKGKQKTWIKGKVSVIVPVYNAEKFLAKALDSILKQTYANLEIIVIDDCSKDRSTKIMKQYSKKDSRIKCYYQEKNKGVAETRNRAIEIAEGQYIAFLDSDDLWFKGKLEKQINLMEKNPNTPMTFTAIQMIDEKDIVIKQKRVVRESINYNQLLRNTMIATSSVVINRNVVPKIVMPLRKSAEDYSLWLSITKEYGMALGINEVLVSYRKTDSQVSAKRTREVKYFYDVQIKDHGINRISAIFNTCIYILNAIKKHYI